MIPTDSFKKIRKRINSYEEDMIQLQIDLTAIPALSPENGGDGEYDKAQFLIEYLRTSGFETIQLFNAPDDRVPSGIRPNVIATVPGRNKNKTVWILTHLDVVPPGELNLWDEAPYKGYVRDGKIYGRGTEDNQQDLVSSLFAAKAFLDENITPESSIGLVFVSDEETGSTKGLGYLMEHHEYLFKKSDIIVVPDFGNPDGSAIEVAEKSILWLRFKTVGKQCHASRPSLGNNAFVAASRLVVSLRNLYTTFNDRDPVYQPPESTFEPTKKDANIPNINTIPGEDVFYLDCRILPSYDLGNIMEKVRSIADDMEHTFGVSIEITPVQSVQAPPPTAHDAPVVFALKEAIKETYGTDAEAIGIGGGTVAANFRKKGFPAAVWSRLCMMAHQPNEYCRVKNMMGNAHVYAHLFMQQH